MKFSQVLATQMERCDCTARELARACGLSAATLSRFRSGERTPSREDLERLIAGLAAVSVQRGRPLSEEALREAFSACAELRLIDPETLRTNLNRLLTVLPISTAELSKAISYDPSFLSRVRSGQRSPADPEKFCADVARFLVRRFDDEKGAAAVAELIGIPTEETENETAYFSAVAQWLAGGTAPDGGAPTQEGSVSAFLQALDSFNLNEYIRAIHFDELKTPTLPFTLPASRVYHGVEEMKRGELDFFKATVLSRSEEPVLLYSDMPMADMAADLDFSKKYMFGLALLLKKGLHLNLIHDLNRPFHELMLGLESHIPLYMTGQISPYYLKDAPNTVFCHFLKVSGAAALAGECIAGQHENGMYYLTKGKSDLAYYRQRASDLLGKAKPLMDIYREPRREALDAFLQAEAQTGGRRRSLLAAPPIYTASEAFLTAFLDRRDVSAKEKQQIFAFAAQQRERLSQLMANGSVRDELPRLTEEEFSAAPPSLPLSELFFERDLVYTYEEYCEHLRLTEEFAAQHGKYEAVVSTDKGFCNINIVLREGKWAMVSKGKTPVIHFVIRHPTLRQAIEDMVLPVVE